jgi:glutamate/tyrosine decarboxylase-like PLP-dependent enzyme
MKFLELLRLIPAVNRRIEAQIEPAMADLERSLKPYRQDFPTYRKLPEVGRAQDEVLAEMKELKEREAGRWQAGKVSGTVYHGEEAYIDFVNQAYALHSQTNPLHPDVFPGVAKYEAEMVAMTAAMLGGEGTDDEIVGTVTSGGTESILLAMKTYRDQANKRKPEVVAPVTAHAAFDKAAHYFGFKLVRTPVGEDYRADVQAMRRAINRRTIALVASAPTFPHGMIDPIPEIAALAKAHRVGCHVDACLGGFVLPFAERLGYAVPVFDFRLPGVTSMSADTHKYGYAPKGTSVVLHRGKAQRHHQYFAVTDWPGGVYASPTVAGSRAGGVIAAGWAAMVSLGEAGYLKAAKAILETADWIKHEIRQIPGVYLMGDPLWVVAFASEELDIYRVMDAMSQRGWNLNSLHRPAAVHLGITLRHTQPGVKEQFAADLRAALAHVRANPGEEGGMAPVYGMAASVPVRSVVSDVLKAYLDTLYEV